MSACQQAKAARRKARHDPRYIHKGTRDKSAADRNFQRKMAKLAELRSRGVKV